jgi:hypothetical protein
VGDGEVAQGRFYIPSLTTGEITMPSRCLVAFIAILCFTPAVLAGVVIYDEVGPLNGEYTISTSATQLGPESFSFVYSITNNNQGSGWPVGLDGFYLDVPVSASISNVVCPAPYAGPPGYWLSDEGTSTTPGCKKLSWGGQHPHSVYPIGTTAQFSFQADGVAVGSTAANVLTYKYDGGGGNWHYSLFLTTLTGPVAILEPVFLLGDANKDGTVNVADLTLLLNNYNKTGMVWADGDFDYDGTVNVADLTALLDNYNRTSGAVASTAVPEPSSIAMLGITLMALLSWWRKRP